MKTLFCLGVLVSFFNPMVAVEASSPKTIRLLVKTKSKIEGSFELSAQTHWKVIQTLESQKKQKIRELQKDPKVEWVEEDRLYHVDAIQNQLPVNDPMAGEQWSLTDSGVIEAWKLVPQNAKDVLVAVVDTGIALAHPDLAAQ